MGFGRERGIPQVDQIKLVRGKILKVALNHGVDPNLLHCSPKKIRLAKRGNKYYLYRLSLYNRS